MMLALGLVMAIIPKQCTRKEFQDNPEMVKKTRRSGIILACAAVALEVVLYMTAGLR
jgi:hypothetical protein